MQRRLDALGAAGWELVALAPESTGSYPGSATSYTLILKRLAAPP